jgi:putative transposase
MIIRKAFQFHLRPTKKQERALQFHLDECRWLYNELLEQRKISYLELEENLTRTQQYSFIPHLVQERPGLDLIHSQVLQNVADRLDKSYKAFFLRVKSGGTPGFPRFKGYNQYNSFCFPQSGFSLSDGVIKLSKIGDVRLKSHREIQGKIKTCTIKKTTSGSWLITFSCEIESNPLSVLENSVGIDVGLTTFAVFSDGKSIENPRFFKKEEEALAKAQKKLAKEEKGTLKRKQKRIIVAKIHQRIANKRKNFCHQESKKIIDNYQYICIEDLNITKMLESGFLSKSISDASWGLFRQHLTYKAEYAGRKLGIVDPAYTSQTCSNCNNVEAKMLSQRKHSCCICGYQDSRDANASKNILALGLDGQQETARSSRLQAGE